MTSLTPNGMPCRRGRRDDRSALLGGGETELRVDVAPAMDEWVAYHHGSRNAGPSCSEVRSPLSSSAAASVAVSAVRSSLVLSVRSVGLQGDETPDVLGGLLDLFARVQEREVLTPRPGLVQVVEVG